jgi:hypothetical protein
MEIDAIARLLPVNMQSGMLLGAKRSAVSALRRLSRARRIAAGLRPVDCSMSQKRRHHVGERRVDRMRQGSLAHAARQFFDRMRAAA